MIGGLRFAKNKFKYVPLLLRGIHITLTHDRQLEAQTDLWLGRHLALVRGRVARLPAGDAQRPLVRALGVHRLEALIVRVGHDADGDDVQVVLADPRDLCVCVCVCKIPTNQLLKRIH